jgi:hypothetical protein
MPQNLSETGIILGLRSTSSDEVVGTIELPWYGKRSVVEVIFESADNGVPNELQVQAFCNLVSGWDGLLNRLIPHVLDFWNTEREAHGQMRGYDSLRPPFPQIREHTDLTGVVVAAMNGEDWCNYIGILAECTWSPEHGLGAKIVDGTVAQVGYQDLVT